MGISNEDLLKVPKNLSIRDCYERIYDWHKKNGKNFILKRPFLDEKYKNAYLKLIDCLPDPENATISDMNFLFGESIFMLMEWCYHEPDIHGIKLAAYAHHAVSAQFAGNINDPLFNKSRKASQLFEKFGYPKWKE